MPMTPNIFRISDAAGPGWNVRYVRNARAAAGNNNPGNNNPVP